MFRQLTAFIIFLSLLVQTLNGPFVLMDYYANSAAFAKNCINKARPKMHCNGKCQAMRKMQEEEKKEQQLPERKFENKIEVLSSKSSYCSVEVPVSIIKKISSPQINSFAVSISLDIFHPPQA